jgi:hypothetical protein
MKENSGRQKMSQNKYTVLSTRDLQCYGLNGTATLVLDGAPDDKEDTKWNDAVSELIEWMYRHKIVNLIDVEMTLARKQAMGSVDRALASNRHPTLEGTSADAMHAYRERFKSTPPTTEES